MGLQSRQKQDPKNACTQLSKNMVPDMEKWFNMTAVIILVLNMEVCSSCSWQIVSFFYGLPIMTIMLPAANRRYG